MRTSTPVEICACPIKDAFSNFPEGFGSNLTLCGAVECDAAVMTEDGHFGSVGALAGVRNPVRAARLILDHSQNLDSIGRVPPLTLVASGAQQFVQARDASLVIDPHSMICENARKDWSRWREKLSHGSIHRPESSGSRSLLQDTVGSIVMNNVGSATSVSRSDFRFRLPYLASRFSRCSRC